MTGFTVGPAATLDSRSTTTGAQAPLSFELVQSPSELERHSEAWDALAVQCGRPYCAPAWMLAWWRHLAPAGAELRTVVVLAGERVVGIAPFFVQRAPAGFSEYRLLASGLTARLGLLALTGIEEQVASVTARTLAEARPRPRAVRFEGTEARSLWSGLLADAWPGRLRPLVHRDVQHPAPTIRLQGSSFEAWFAARSPNFRQQMRRMHRKFVACGGHIRMSSGAHIDRDLAAFCRLHRARWAPRGGSGSLPAGTEEMLYEAAMWLLPQGRFRLWMMEIGGETVSAHLFVAAGGEVGYHVGGFDPRWAELKPSMLTLLEAIKDSFDRGDRRVDLGQGAQPYKLRLADGDDPATWLALFPRDARYPVTMIQALPAHLRFKLRAAGRRLQPETRRRIKRVLRQQVPQ